MKRVIFGNGHRTEYSHYHQSGETGVGKELVVQQLHKNSDRKSMPFIKVNCAALPDTLLESEMFGYERGAFTGAVRRQRDKFEQAKKGVLFLDEIGDMTIGLQSKLLHALQDGEFIPLGSERTIKSNSWVISATNQDLQCDIEQGKFRRDLYYRINTITINIDPLRERPEDIPPLIEYFTRKYSAQFKGKGFQTLSNRTLDRIIAYPLSSTFFAEAHILTSVSLQMLLLAAAYHNGLLLMGIT